MKTIIAGSRTIKDYAIVARAIKNAPWAVSTVVSGCAAGVDTLGERWARVYDIPVLKFPADWNTFGRSAGYKRNLQMADNAEALIAIWDGISKGTKHMIDIAEQKRLTVFVFRTDQEAQS